MNLFILFWIIGLSRSTETDNTVTNFLKDQTVTVDILEGISETKLRVRKCCSTLEYYSTTIHECTPINTNSRFKTNVGRFLLNSTTQEFITETGKIQFCPGTNEAPTYIDTLDPYTYSFLKDGQLQDHATGEVFDQAHYCLEMVGSVVDSAVLGLVYCLSSENRIPKCCPKGHYYDSRSSGCSPFNSKNLNEGFLELLPFLPQNSKLVYNPDFTCLDLPVKVNLKEVTIFKNMICLAKMKRCLTIDKFCVDNMLKDGESVLTQSAYVCPENFLKKCCPDGFGLSEEGCVDIPRSSLSLVYTLRSLRYHVKSVSQNRSICTPVMIEESTRSRIPWTINSDGKAEITLENTTITTSRYCLDDFINGRDVFPVLKVCSDEVKVYSEDFVKESSSNTVRKCCKSDHLVSLLGNDSKNWQCVEMNEENYEMQKEFIHRNNISHLLHTNLPECLKGVHHIYPLEPAYEDYTMLTNGGNLKIISKHNGCQIKESQTNSSLFCVDLVVKAEGITKPMAFVCAAENINFHEEKGFVLVSFVGISCAALIAAFFSLVFTRVRRGMVTTKKVSSDVVF